MAYFTTLYSGSSGNCALIRSEDKYLLIDMGKSCRTTLTALKSLGKSTPSRCTDVPIRWIRWPPAARFRPRWRQSL